MQPLRAYLWIVASDGSSSVTVHRDLDSLRSEWQRRDFTAQLAGAIHVGFARPETAEITGVAVGHLGRMLLTASARYALSQFTTVADSAIGKIGDMPVFG